MSDHNEELQSLKERAKVLGISHSPNIGLEALRAKVNGAVSNDTPAEEPVVNRTPAPAVREKTKQELYIEERDKQHAEQLALVRIRINCLNPLKAQVPGEIITVVNKFLGEVKKFVPFGEETDNGYHVPRILVEELKSRRFNSLRTKKLPNGGTEIQQRMVPEFAIEELPQLTQAELDKLAAAQLAAAGL